MNGTSRRLGVGGVRLATVAHIQKGGAVLVVLVDLYHLGSKVFRWGCACNETVACWDSDGDLIVFDLDCCAVRGPRPLLCFILTRNEAHRRQLRLDFCVRRLLRDPRAGRWLIGHARLYFITGAYA